MNADEQHERAVPLSAIDHHVLMVLSDEDLYGYAIMKAVERESGGGVSPEIGSLYRILARLMTEGYVEEVGAPKGAPSEHRGRPRRYYRLTRAGLVALRRESHRLQGVLELARDRSLLPEVSA